MDAEIQALEVNKTWTVTTCLLGRLLLDVNGCIRLNIKLMALWKGVRPG